MEIKINKESRVSNFNGPLFIVGMPRSGTKLLRGLLNEHPRIRIPSIETEFIPHWKHHWSSFGDLSNPTMFKKFYKEASKTPYFIYMKEMNKMIEERVWFEYCKNFTLQEIFEALIRHDANIDYNLKKIWGDKSPSYIRHLPLLKENFPDARFIHIIRDVRDYCLSINKAWGKNMIRAAQRWVDDVQKCKNDSKAFSQDYIELRFEDLLKNTEQELKRICHFLDLEFNQNMLSLSKPTENIGSAKGVKEIVTGNQGKYLDQMKISVQNQIECIAAPTLKSHGYAVNYSNRAHQVSRIRMLCYQIIDGINLVKSTINQRGLLGSLVFCWKSFKISGNRS